MKVQGKPYRTIWRKSGSELVVQIIDQRHLPHRFVIEDLKTSDDVVEAINQMHVRGAPLIGITAAYGMCFATHEISSVTNFDDHLSNCTEKLLASRPTAINLAWAVEHMRAVINQADSLQDKQQAAWAEVDALVEEELVRSQQMARHGAEVIHRLAEEKRGKPFNILTHCNAGWLATIDYGTATAPIYQVFQEELNVHVWVDETRPRNQGASLTAWELHQHGVPHTVIADNAGGHLMQQGLVDLVIVGTDRTTRNGDVINKIGTYLKALAAHDNNVPFYVALPSSSLDWSAVSGADVPIEKRSADEVKYVQGQVDGEIKQVLITPAESPALNYGFDVTPARLVTGLITERGVCRASEEGLATLFPEQSHG